MLTKMPVPTIEPRPMNTAPGTPSTRDSCELRGGGESFDDIERLVDVLGETDARIEAVAADAGLIEHERDAARQAQSTLDAPALRELTTRIGEQRKRQPVAILELRVRAGVVARHADHGSP